MLKNTVKRGLEYCAAYLGKHRHHAKVPELLVLGYHRILPKDHPHYHIMQPGMRVRPETLEMHIQVLKRYFEIVDLNEWMHKLKRGYPLPHKAAAITFDDGWRDNYEFAFPILKSENVPATIFLVSGMIDTDKQFWPERVRRIIEVVRGKNEVSTESKLVQWFNTHGIDVNAVQALNEEKIDNVINALKKYPDEFIYESLNVFHELEMKYQEREFSSQMLSSQQINEMKESALVTYGAHTRNHYRLNKVEEADVLQNEIIKCKSDLESSLNIEVSGFCYPNGDFDEKSLDLVKQEYEYACTVRRGWFRKGDDPYLMNRVLVHDDVSYDRVSFEARISGLL